MARPRKPTKIIDLQGGFKKNPQRKEERASEPQPTAANLKPARHLPAGQKKIWREIVGNVPAGVITDMDRQVMELTCALMDRFRKSNTGELDMYGQPIKFTASDVAQLRGCLQSLGMTPADRSRVSVPKEDKPKDGWDGA